MIGIDVDVGEGVYTLDTCTFLNDVGELTPERVGTVYFGDAAGDDEGGGVLKEGGVAFLAPDGSPKSRRLLFFDL